MDDFKKNNLTQHQLRAELDARAERLDYHLAGLKSEFTLADVNVGGRPLLDHVREQPLVALGVAAGVGAILGIVTGAAKRDKYEGPSEHELWMSAYMDDLLEESGARVNKGDDPDSALRRSLRRRAPVIVLEPEEDTVQSHTVSAFKVLLNTALGFGVKFALDHMAQQLTGEDEIVEAMTDAP